MRYKWIGVSLYSTDMAEFYVMNQTLTSDKVKYIIGNIRTIAKFLVIFNIINFLFSEEDRSDNSALH